MRYEYRVQSKGDPWMPECPVHSSKKRALEEMARLRGDAARYGDNWKYWIERRLLTPWEKI